MIITLIYRILCYLNEQKVFQKENGMPGYGGNALSFLEKYTKYK